jgi:hypothetical protein
VVGRAFAGDPNGANFAYQAVKAYYAGKSARDGDVSGQIDTGRLKEAVNAVIGGVTDVNGKGEVVRPWGMSEERFKNGIQFAFKEAITANGYTGTVLDNFGAYGAQSAGDGKYLMRSGSGYLTDKNGNPIVLDLTKGEKAVAQIPTGGGQVPAASGPVKMDKPAVPSNMSSGRVQDPTLVPPATVFRDPTKKPNTSEPKTK